eukprot:Phypoly_transcript_05199.p1 GENE.Phypoly_transcript_05199~~Phypoly_transcript_05199.p1  ORF type:complete len:609 (+),score=172.80 Phypoly_transcript_05199:71-1897(+)
MLDYFTIFNKRGIVLFSYPQAKKLPGAPVDRLIKDVLLEERSGENSYSLDSYALKWTFANEFDLIFVAVYQKIFTLLYIDELLELVKQRFCELFQTLIPPGTHPSNVVTTVNFDDEYNDILERVETTSKKRPIVKQKTFEQTSKGQDIIKGKDDKPKKDKKKKKKKGDASDPDGDGEDEGEEKGDDAAEPGETEIERNRRLFKARQLGLNKKKDDKPKEEPVKKKKVLRNKDGTAAANNEPIKLNYGADPSTVQEEKVKIENLPFDLNKYGDPVSDDESDEEEPEEQKPSSSSAPAPKKSSFGFFTKYLSNLTGNKVLEKEDLEPILSKFRVHLMEKNVATEIADKLCQSVGASLEGKKLTTFQGIKKTVTAGLEEALTRILTPKRQIDILREVAALRGTRPYTIVFCGVNGVGKSTNLAKVCSWLLSNNLRVMIAACDTFRSGAVEQLRVHSRRLDVPVYDRGYGKDAAGIAAEAISYAKDNNFDVVMVDTAGRMQDNKPLMVALAKLVNTNPVDLVLFVGEALVGNDGVDQLVKFNEALADHSTTNPPRLVDGIILTKFDTVDTKVGAAISMVYSTGQPIVFLGTGQHYNDLKQLNVAHTVKTLLK